MNDLNTQQIVLLCLLVSFVSSVATGITTVSLLDQAPEPVTQTINRVVERTIEKVVDPVVESVSNVGTNKTPERVVETVVVNQEDLTVDAIEKNSKSLVRIYAINSVGIKSFAGLGVVISSDGKVITSSTVLEISKRFSVEYADKSYEVDISKPSNNGTVVFAPRDVEEGKTFSSATFANSQNVKLGQSVIALSGQDRNIVSTGIVNSLEPQDGSEVRSIDTSISSESIIRGSVLMNLKGEIIGMRVAGSSASAFVSSNIIKSSIGI